MSHLPHPAGGGLISGFVPQDLILDHEMIKFIPATLASGVAYKAGSVLGRISAGAVTSAAKSGGNTGTGTFTVDVTHPKRLNVKVGTYTLRCVIAKVTSVHDGEFELKDPDGKSLGLYQLPTGGAGSVTIDDGIKGALAGTGTFFVVGDGFDIAVAAGSNYMALAAAAAEDGSADPFAVLLEDVDCTGGAKNCPVAAQGYFNEEQLVFGTGHTADTVRVALRRLGILIRTMKYSG